MPKDFKYQGRPYSEWMNKVQKLDDKGKIDIALNLLFELIGVVEEEAHELGMPPAPAYAAYAADLLARKGEFHSAIAVLTRYEEVAKATSGEVVPTIAALRREIQREMELGPLPEENRDCPSCGVLMDPPPKRSGKCKNCDTRILARKHEGITVLRTEKQQNEFKRLQEIEEKNERIFVRANKIGISDNEMFTFAQEFQERNGFAPSFGDAFWSLATAKQNQQVAHSDRFSDVALIYRATSEHLCDENRNWIELAKQAVKYELLDLKKFEELITRLITVGCGCNQCSTMEEIITLEAALNQSEIPHTDCETPPCLCFYRPAWE